jgi:hypothetical protein
MVISAMEGGESETAGQRQASAALSGQHGLTKRKTWCSGLAWPVQNKDESDAAAIWSLGSAS